MSHSAVKVSWKFSNLVSGDSLKPPKSNAEGSSKALTGGLTAAPSRELSIQI